MTENHGGPGSVALSLPFPSGGCCKTRFGELAIATDVKLGNREGARGDAGDK